MILTTRYPRFPSFSMFCRMFVADSPSRPWKNKKRTAHLIILRKSVTTLQCLYIPTRGETMVDPRNRMRQGVHPRVSKFHDYIEIVLRVSNHKLQRSRCGEDINHYPSHACDPFHNKASPGCHRGEMQPHQASSPRTIVSYTDTSTKPYSSMSANCSRKCIQASVHTIIPLGALLSNKGRSPIPWIPYWHTPRHGLEVRKHCNTTTNPNILRLQ